MAIVQGVATPSVAMEGETLKTLRLHHGPLHSLETAYRAAYECVDVSDAEGVGQYAVGIDHISYGVLGKIAVIGATRGGIFMQRARGAIGRADEVGTYYKITCRVEKHTFLHRVGPPVLHVTVGSQGMTHPHDVVALLVERAIGIVSDAQTLERAAKFECER